MSWRRWERVPWNALTLVLALVAAGIAEHRWVAAHADAAVVLTVVLETPVLRSITEAVTGEPLEQDAPIAGMPALLVQPEGDGPWPALVFVNGATRHGRHHPTVRRLAQGLARAGFLVVVPDPPGLSRGEITPRTLEAVTAVVRATAVHPDAREGKVGLVGVSVGASLALLAAAEPDVADDITVVAGIAPYGDLREVMLLATTGHHRVGGRLVAYEADPFVQLVVGRSLAAELPPGADRRRLVGRMLAVPWESDAPLDSLRRGPPVGLGPEGQALVRLLLNRDPRRFDELYLALPERVRTGVRRLSPLVRARSVRAPVELASAPVDKYFPLDESEALVVTAPEARLTVTAILRHAIPDPSPGGVADLVRLDGFVSRVLRRAAE